MENSVQFTKKPFHGVFSEAARELGLEGDNARQLARKYYSTGNQKAVEVVTRLIVKRNTLEQNRRAAVEKAMELQNTAGGAK